AGHRRAAHHPVLVLGDTRHRQVGLDPAALVEPVGIDDPARLDVDVGRRYALQAAAGVATAHEVLGEARLVEQRHPLARGGMLGGGVAEPVLPAEGILVARFYARRSEPVGPLPAGYLAEAGAVRGESLVNRRVAYIASGL